MLFALFDSGNYQQGRVTPWQWMSATFSNCSKDELDFIEKGGYGRSVRTPWQSKSTFQDSLTCINYGDPNRAHPCNECHLLDFVDPEHRTEAVPCHFVPLNREGETNEDLEQQDKQAKVEREVARTLTTPY